MDKTKEFLKYAYAIKQHHHLVKSFELDTNSILKSYTLTLTDGKVIDCLPTYEAGRDELELYIVKKGEL